MPLEIKVLGWRAAGLRCVDHEVNFQKKDDQTHRISLIQMPNGNGKTTTLELLRAALSGAELENVNRFAKSGSSAGEFELKLLLNKKRTTVIMNFDFDAGKLHYTTTRGKGKVSGFDPPIEFKQFMNENFVNFFVFDGELAQNLLDQTKTNADSVINHLFQINVLKIIEDRVKTHWDIHRAKVKATDQVGLTRRTNKVVLLSQRLKEAETKLSELRARKTKLEYAIKIQTNEFDRQIKGGKKAQDDLIASRDKIVHLEGRSREAASALLDQMRDPCSLSPLISARLIDFRQGLDRVKLPESAAREFFEELAEEELCICGREINCTIAQAIRVRALQYLGSDDVSLLNGIKSSIDSSTGISGQLAEELSRTVLGLDDSEKQLAEARTELDRLVSLAKVDPKVRQADAELEDLKARLLKIDAGLEDFDDDNETIPDDKLLCIAVIKKKLKEAEGELAEITKTVQIKAKRDVLVTILQDAWTSASTIMKRELRTQANVRINELLPNNKIEIEGIDGALRLAGKERGSVGETLSVGYAFLSCLYNRAQHQIPFIVDSPAGPLDLDVRSEISALVPKLSGQFIAFLISSELQNFTKPLSKNCDDIQYLTIFRRGLDDYDQSAKKQKSHMETADGFIVMGQNFFESFQLEKQ